MPALSKNAQRLLTLSVPIRCRTEEERIGVERWCAEWDTLLQAGTRWHEATRLSDRLADEKRERCAEIAVAVGLTNLGAVMQELRRSGHPSDNIPHLMWRLVLSADFALIIGPRRPACYDPTPEEAKHIAQSIREYFQGLRDHADVFGEFDPLLVAAAIDCILAMADDAIASLHCIVIVDTVAEILGVGERAAFRTFIEPAAVARANQRSADVRAELAARAGDLAGAGQAADAATDEFVRRVKFARGLLPESGEAADLSQLISLVDRTLIRSRDPNAPKPARPGNNRVLYRMAVWLALGEIRWDADCRETLLQLVERPRKFLRHQPSTAAGMDAKRMLRCLRDAVCGAKPVHEHRSLLENIRTAKSDAEILWVLSEYILPRFHRGAFVGEMGEVGERFVDALLEIVDADILHCLRLYAQVHVYDGKATLRTALDVEVERLEAEEREFEAALRAEVGDEPAPGPAAGYPLFRRQRPATLSTSAPVPRVRLSYVANPESVAPREYVIDCNKGDAYGQILAMLEEHAVTPEPAASLARAIHHYAFETSDEIRKTWNKERIGSFIFHKLKRGRARIYVRTDGENVTFHAYSRRDWEMPDAQK